MTPLGPHLTVFLREYLPNQREMSVQTSDTYAYAFQLLVCFAAERLKVTPSELSVEQLDATLVLAFLEHLEKARENCARTATRDWPLSRPSSSSLSTDCRPASNKPEECARSRSRRPMRSSSDT